MKVFFFFIFLQPHVHRHLQNLSCSLHAFNTWNQHKKEHIDNKEQRQKNNFLLLLYLMILRTYSKLQTPNLILKTSEYNEPQKINSPYPAFWIFCKVFCLWIYPPSKSTIMKTFIYQYKKRRRKLGQKTFISMFPFQSSSVSYGFHIKIFPPTFPKFYFRSSLCQ